MKTNPHNSALSFGTDAILSDFDHLSAGILLDPSKRKFPPFDLIRLLATVFNPTAGSRVCILTDFENPGPLMRDFAFLQNPGYPVQKQAHRTFYERLRDGDWMHCA